MIFFKGFVNNLQTHIIAFFSLLLFFSFLAVGLIFNFAVNFYLSQSAVDALSRARAAYLVENANDTDGLIRIVQGSNQSFFRYVPTFELGEDYVPQIDGHLMGIYLSRDAVSIAEYMANEEVPLVYTSAARIRLEDQTFYISILPVIIDDLRFTVFYLDITDIVRFTAVINRVLVLLVAIIWIVSIVLTGFMADSLIKPLRKLRDFIRQIGKGNFTQHDLVFASEEFQELNQSLNQAARQLASYDNEQKTFFQNVSHELRTPLMSIKSYAEGIKYGVMEPYPASETILEATDQLTEMVDDIIYVSRIDSLVTPEMHRANLSAIIDGRIAYYKPVAINKSLELKLISSGEPIFINCVPSYIERSIDNLLTNAIRYASMLIVVEIYGQGNNAILKVIDDGPGFDPEGISRVFERFYKGKNGVTGIGLAIVKAITDQHKGTATAENGSDCGAILTLSLPKL